MNDLETEIEISELARFWIGAEVSVVHAGAHLGEEAADYKAANWSNVIWIEANPDLIPKLVEVTSIYPMNKVVHAAIWSTSNFPITLNIANNSYSSSVLNFGSHKKTYPDIAFNGQVELPSTSLDDILTSHPISPPRGGLLILDLQGVELEALVGARNCLENFDWVYTEVSKGDLYEGQSTWKEISQLLKSHGFLLVDWQYSQNLDWGNALYKRTSNPLLIWRRLYRLWCRRRSLLS